MLCNLCVALEYYQSQSAGSEGKNYQIWNHINSKMGLKLKDQFMGIKGIEEHKYQKFQPRKTQDRVRLVTDRDPCRQVNTTDAWQQIWEISHQETSPKAGKPVTSVTEDIHRKPINALRTVLHSFLSSFIHSMKKNIYITPLYICQSLF